MAVSPQFARAVQVEENLYAEIDHEFGLLTSDEAADRMRAADVDQEDAVAAARADGRLLALAKEPDLLFPGFQLDDHGIRPVIADYLRLGREFGRSERGLIQWLVAPTTYLDGQRPVDIIDEPDRLLATARQAFGIQW